jgi:hypothetical protein
MTNLTEMETICLNVMGDFTSYDTLEETLDDNMCCATLRDFPIERSQVRGVLSSLIKKGLCFFDDGEDYGDGVPSVWWLTDLGVETYWAAK